MRMAGRFCRMHGFGPAIFLLVATLVAGCAGIGDSESSARKHFEKATRLAKAWSSDASLVEIAGGEGYILPHWYEYGYFAGDDEPEWHVAIINAARNDSAIGDGRARFWIYDYASDSLKENYWIILRGDGNVIPTEPRTRYREVGSVGPWRVDSNDAMEKMKEKLRDGSVDYRSATYVLEDPEDCDSENPCWMITQVTGIRETAAYKEAKVDAIDGTVSLR